MIGFFSSGNVFKVHPHVARFGAFSTYCMLFIHLSGDGRLGSFHSLSFVTQAAVNVVHRSLCGHVSVSLGSEKCWELLKSCQTLS